MNRFKTIKIILYATLFLVLVFPAVQSTNKKPVSQISLSQGQTISPITPGPPMRLTIPTINVDAAIQHVGVSPKGEMEVPSNTVDVAWFKPGSLPGEKGSAVIAGHLDGKNGEVGVFTNLDKLKEGDMLYVEDNAGVLIAFVVRESLIYDPGYADNVFNRNDNAHLNLITCAGAWDGDKNTYSKRLVVFADIAPLEGA